MRDLQNEIVTEQAKLTSDLKAYQRLMIYNAIIEMRKLSGNPNDKKYLYSDIKNYFSNAISAIEEPFFEYYEIEESKVISLLSGIKLIEQVSLLGYLQNNLKKNGYGEKYRWLSKLEKRKIIAFHVENISYKNFLKLCKEIVTYNAVSILVTILLLFVFYSILLLPTTNQNLACFKPEFKHYSNIRLVNHFLNTTLSFLCLDDDFKIHPINTTGVLLVILFKGLIFISIVSYLYEQLKQRLKF